jgi:hypothetical protein
VRPRHAAKKMFGGSLMPAGSAACRFRSVTGLKRADGTLDAEAYRALVARA